MKDFSQYKIQYNKSIREAFKKTDLNKQIHLGCNYEDEIIGIITDGDFRRAIWSGVSFETTAGELAQKIFITWKKILVKARLLKYLNHQT